MDMRLEVVVIGVSDVDRAKAFYEQLGFRLDADFPAPDGLRVVQLTPPGSACSLIFGDKLTAAKPGSADGLMLVVEDLDAARADLVGRGIDVSEIWHDVGGVFHHGGTDGRRSGSRPPEPVVLLVRVVQRSRRQRLVHPRDQDAPPRPMSEPMDIAQLADLLHETADHHGAYEAIAPKHNWWDWYAAYMTARNQGVASDEASASARRYMADIKHIVVP